MRNALAVFETQALPWFDEQADLEAAFAYQKRISWIAARRDFGRPDQFFMSEDLFAALAIRLGRLDEAIALFEAIVARKYDAQVREAYQKADERRIHRLQRLVRRKRLEIEPVPFWHDGAVMRLEALRAHRG